MSDAEDARRWRTLMGRQINMHDLRERLERCEKQHQDHQEELARIQGMSVHVDRVAALAAYGKSVKLDFGSLVIKRYIDAQIKHEDAQKAEKPA